MKFCIVVEHQIFFRIKLIARGTWNFFGFVCLLQDRIDRIRVDIFRVFTHQPQYYGPVAAMTLAGECQRSMQGSTNANNFRQGRPWPVAVFDLV